ncbi:hypothetical protein EAE96_010742 [Botrytis aclada]|nr:hypothetical protein EAE96_010742 [Botrytis aclada]
MTCSEASNDTKTVIRKAIYTIGMSSQLSRPPPFLAFTPVIDGNTNVGNDLNTIFSGASIFRSFDDTSMIAKTFLVYGQWDEGNTLECGLYNASYEVNVEFNNGAQSISVQKMTTLNGLTYRQSSPYFMLNSYNSSVGGQNATAAASNLYWTRESMHQLAYQAIGQAVNKKLVGFIDDSMYSGVISRNTQVLSSSLASTPELGPFATMQKSLSVDPRAPAVDYSLNTLLAQAVKDLTINVTISLFSSPEFLQGASSITSYMAP